MAIRRYITVFRYDAIPGQVAQTAGGQLHSTTNPQVAAAALAAAQAIAAKVIEGGYTFPADGAQHAGLTVSQSSVALNSDGTEPVLTPDDPPMHHDVHLEFSPKGGTVPTVLKAQCYNDFTILEAQGASDCMHAFRDELQLGNLLPLNAANPGWQAKAVVVGG